MHQILDPYLDLVDRGIGVFSVPRPTNHNHNLSKSKLQELTIIHGSAKYFVRFLAAPFYDYLIPNAVLFFRNKITRYFLSIRISKPATMAQQQQDMPTFKLVLVGDGGVGELIIQFLALLVIET